MNRVQRGQRFAVTADAWNAMLQAADDLSARRNTFGREWRETFAQACIITVRNDSGGDRQRFNVLGMASTVISPESNLDEFKSRVALGMAVPDIETHVGRWAVLLEPVKAGELGRAVAAGVTVCRVDVKAEGDTHAEIADEQCEYLVSGRTGSAAILWAEAGTGVKWAVVRIGNAGDGPVWAQAQYNWHNAAGDDSYVTCDLYPRQDCDGDAIQTTVQVYLPRGGSVLDPNVVQYQVLECVWDALQERWIARGQYLDGVINKSVAMWAGDPTNLASERPGWALGPIIGRFPVGYSSGETDYDAIAKTGGHKWHGKTENNHPEHNEGHTHPPKYPDNCFPYLDGPSTAGIPIKEPLTIGAAIWDDAEHGVHKGIYNAGDDTDNRPPYYVIAFIQRVDNSV